MPTIIIPDKTCPCCGGVKWIKNVSRKDGYTRYMCFYKNADNRKRWRATEKGKIFTNTYPQTETGKKHRKKYLEKESTKQLLAKLARNKYHRDMMENPEKVRVIKRKSAKMLRDKLTDGVIKHTIVRSHKETGLSHLDIPQELITLKRKQICLHRQLKSLT